MSVQQNIYRQRHNFSKIRSLVPIPNLIDIQKRSYDEFLQMNLLHGEREVRGLKSVFESMFPVQNGKNADGTDATLEIEFLDYTVGHWACKCQKFVGLEHLRTVCKNCNHSIVTDHPKDPSVDCPKCGTRNKNAATICDVCSEPVRLHSKMSMEECVERGATMASPLKIRVRLNQFEKDDKGNRRYKQSQESEVYFGDVPTMTDRGTFIINGTERVIVSQLHRSPGVFFSISPDKTQYSAQIIPYRGSWIEFELDAKGLLYARIDRKRKFLGSTFLRALGLFDENMADNQGLLRHFYTPARFILKGSKISMVPGDLMLGHTSPEDVKDPKSKGVIVAAHKKISRRLLEHMLKAGVKQVAVERDVLDGAVLLNDVVNMNTGEVLLEANEPFLQTHLEMFQAGNVTEFEVCFPEMDATGKVFSETLMKDHTEDAEEAAKELFKKIRPGEPATLESSKKLLYGMFFDPQKYDLSKVGRHKLNAKLALETEMDARALRTGDFVHTVHYLLRLKKYDTTRQEMGDIAPVRADDIDHLGNRRVRSVGELLENCFRVGLVRVQRAIKEKFSMAQDPNSPLQAHDLINSKPVIAAMKEFFGSSQLSQFMDQTNPLSEITHKRRLSALGPGGLTRERAGFEVRDVHVTHYGRICPIETPEGPNIGLINSLATFAQVNKYGFIESPYRKVKDSKVTNDVVLLSAMQEARHYIAQANASMSKDGKLTDETVICRHAGEVLQVPRDKVDFIDVSPKQLVSVAAALIPFLENDDANRALMGSNMQRQAVPLVRAEAPFVGTGMESVVARDSGAAIGARRTGIIDQVDATRIVIRATEETDPSKPGVDIYRLRKFQRSNQSTCINQRPLVKVGDSVRAGEIIADGPSTDLGDLALGRNILVAFMPWMGYNFEDSILINERIVKDDVFTSIHIEEFEVMARDTKLGPEEITRDIPNVSEEALKNLDEAGIVYIGAEVKPGDILVGKITPKGESPMTPEEKLLRAIFGEKASDVRDTSLKLPPGVTGTVVEVRVFNRHGVEKDERAMAIEREEIERLAKDRDDELQILDRNVYGRMKDGLLGKESSKGPKGARKGTALTVEILDDIPRSQWWEIALVDEGAMTEIEAIKRQYESAKKSLEKRFLDKVEKLQRGDELPPGVMKMVKVFVAVKRKLQPGDKMAGRHGNKGVVSMIVPGADMPYLDDGTPVDIVLNPLGVPSRMNVGQILETHLGWACAGLGKKIGEAVASYRVNHKIKGVRDVLHSIYGDESEATKLDDEGTIALAEQLRPGVPIATPVFDGAREPDIVELLKMAGFDSSGQVVLHDGRTGEQFDRKVTVGYKYLLKLHHLVDDKIHARSIGPYSLVTQQPLGGKAQFGGQRFGEMEVWALEAYGAAYTLQEMLTVKSDDVAGRTKVYEAIVRGDDAMEAGIPESFNVLVKEMRALGLNVELVDSQSGVLPVEKPSPNRPRLPLKPPIADAAE